MRAFISLKYRLALLSLLLATAITAFLSIVEIERANADRRQHLARELARFEKLEIPFLTLKMWQLDYPSLVPVLDNYLHNSLFSGLHLVDERGRTLFRGGREAGPETDSTLFPLVKRHDEREFQVGQVELFSEIPGRLTTLRANLPMVLLFNGLLVGTLFFCLYIFFSRTLLRRLHGLSEWCREVDVSHPGAMPAMLLRGGSDDEISLLSRSFNTMVERVGEELRRRRQMEEELRRSEYSYRIMFENNPLGVIRIDSNGHIQECNDKFLEMMGAGREKVTGFHAASNSNPEMRRAIRTALQGEVSVYENTYTSVTGGKNTYLRGVFNPVSLGVAPTEVIASFEDISQWRHAQLEKAILQEQLQQAQKMESVGRLAGGVAHDFNNMLTVILGYTEIGLRCVAESSPIHSQLVEIKKAAEHSAELTRQLLAFARKQVINPLEVDLNETVAGMLGMLGRLLGEEVRLEWRPGAELWPVRIDPTQVNQILVNLSVNARDAVGGAGTIVVSSENRRLTADDCRQIADCRPGEYVLLSVSDYGEGIDPAHLSRIFEPFFTTKPFGKGTGLGLATVYGSVKQNQGFIEVVSRLGEGTSFRCYFPRHGEDTSPSPPPGA